MGFSLLFVGVYGYDGKEFSRNVAVLLSYHANYIHYLKYADKGVSTVMLSPHQYDLKDDHATDQTPSSKQQRQ
jgi:hypothetical protein